MNRLARILPVLWYEVWNNGNRKLKRSLWQGVIKSCPGDERVVALDADLSGSTMTILLEKENAREIF
jgi:transketolase C-terminal domain/subunit